MSQGPCILYLDFCSLQHQGRSVCLAGLSALWMGAGWNYYLYYTNIASEPE